LFAKRVGVFIELQPESKVGFRNLSLALDIGDGLIRRPSICRNEISRNDAHASTDSLSAMDEDSACWIPIERISDE
jgi:hypothetical protein